MPEVLLYSRRENEVQRQAGLNWGFSDGHVNVADAYIALNLSFFRENQYFFPSHGTTINVIWDDGVMMTCSLEGTQQIDGETYPKQISTYNDKSILGMYLRNRIAVSNTHRVTRRDLQAYGRESVHVTFDAEDDTFYFDFSVI
ncbi:restriction endonuclease PLD domain-containing protein [Sporosarcina psychrophila]|uniref:restriction endonuclease PLD domain-containing protein n=1 Tax=Sporosarcina psychrophila TaxID=1476 RepID=UPI00078DEC87|nr:restriction endonuclease PLD domain-containing protein [Sporosarcina psychrophila]AMQ04623.1 hypothetical protein AZE41_00830 [Sporosarcina psychrophila]